MKSYELETKLKSLTESYRAAVDKELTDLVTTIRVEGKKVNLAFEKINQQISYELTNVASSNGSTWSGGNSISNMIEQIKREAAIQMLRDIARYNA